MFYNLNKRYRSHFGSSFQKTFLHISVQHLETSLTSVMNYYHDMIPHVSNFEQMHANFDQFCNGQPPYNFSTNGYHGAFHHGRQNCDQPARQNWNQLARQNCDQPARQNWNQLARQNCDQPARQNWNHSSQQNWNHSSQQNWNHSSQQQNWGQPARQNWNHSSQQQNWNQNTQKWVSPSSGPVRAHSISSVRKQYGACHGQVWCHHNAECLSFLNGTCHFRHRSAHIEEMNLCLRQRLATDKELFAKLRKAMDERNALANARKYEEATESAESTSSTRDTRDEEVVNLPPGYEHYKPPTPASSNRSSSAPQHRKRHSSPPRQSASEGASSRN
jgi:hypothetical protein